VKGAPPESSAASIGSRRGPGADTAIGRSTRGEPARGGLCENREQDGERQRPHAVFSGRASTNFCSASETSAERRSRGRRGTDAIQAAQRSEVVEEALERRDGDQHHRATRAAWLRS
jgi:hypothetical protein